MIRQVTLVLILAIVCVRPLVALLDFHIVYKSVKAAHFHNVNRTSLVVAGSVLLPSVTVALPAAAARVSVLKTPLLVLGLVPRAQEPIVALPAAVAREFVLKRLTSLGLAPRRQAQPVAMIAALATPIVPRQNVAPLVVLAALALEQVLLLDLVLVRRPESAHQSAVLPCQILSAILVSAP